ncbi:MAG: glycosyltransferase [Methanosphaera sp.]|nr:glycosyltransferase [Methanosphaera sp.]
MIEHANIIYMPTISALGGIETYVYELVKKYGDLDIAVVSKTCNELQAARIRKHCKLYIWNGEKIKCKVAIINYDQSIIPYINEDAKIYQTIHADYTNESVYGGRYPKPNERINAFLGITKYLKDKMSDVLKPNQIELCYNPLTIDEDKPIIIVSATRLHKHKGLDRMKTLINKLDRAKVNYLWFVITNEEVDFKSDNVVLIKNRLDISKWLNLATYVCLLSDSEACSYTLNEALYRNIPIITTPLPYLDEIGVKDGVNAYIMQFDCSNVDYIVENINNIPKFNFKRLEDNYKNIFVNKKSNYKEVMKMKVKVKCIQNYYDMECSERKVVSKDTPYENPQQHPNRCEWITTRERAEHLKSKGLVEILETINEVVKEDKKKPTKKIEKK